MFPFQLESNFSGFKTAIVGAVKGKEETCMTDQTMFESIDISSSWSDTCMDLPSRSITILVFYKLGHDLF